MTRPVQTHYGRPDPAEPPIAEIRKVYRPANKTAALELQVNIEGRNRTVLLTLDALEGHGLSGPVAVPAYVVVTSSDLDTSREQGIGERTFMDKQVFHYIYGVLHSPEYRRRYADFLKSDFPRIPLTDDRGLFAAVAELGQRLGALHLMEAQSENPPAFPRTGGNRVERVRYAPPSSADEPARVWINRDQSFEGVAPETWEFAIGGYRPAEKWLKDRKSRVLSFDDIAHYCSLCGASCGNTSNNDPHRRGHRGTRRMAVNRHQPNFSVRLNIFESMPRERLPGDAAAESEVELVDGGQRCPLRDVGGPDGFMEFLGAILDPGHEQHRDMIELWPRVGDGLREGGGVSWGVTKPPGLQARSDTP